MNRRQSGVAAVLFRLQQRWLMSYFFIRKRETPRNRAIKNAKQLSDRLGCDLREPLTRQNKLTANPQQSAKGLREGKLTRL